MFKRNRAIRGADELLKINMPKYKEIRSFYYFSAVAFIILLSFSYSHTLSVSTNVSSLLQDGERLLSGEILYTEVPEINPPASVFLYIPAVWLERTTGLKAEHNVFGLMVFLIVITVELSSRVLYENGLIKDRYRWGVFSIFAMCLVALDSFAEREHIALMLTLPILTIVACRLETKAVPKCRSILFGLMAGVAVCIKPHFAAAILIPQSYAAIKGKSFAALFCTENIIVTLAVLSYSTIFIAYYGQYFDLILPKAIDVYMAHRIPISYMILAISPLLMAFLATLSLTWKIGPPGVSETNAVLILSAVGFVIAYIVQGKIWSYHYYPAAALVLLVALDVTALKLSLLKKDDPDRSRQFMACGIALFSMTLIEILLFRPLAQDSLDLVDLIKKSYHSPSVIAISGDVGISYPLIRRVNGKSASDSGCCLITENVHNILRSNSDMPEDQKIALERWESKDREALIHDFVKWKPDVLLVDTRTWFVDWVSWIKQDNRLAALACHYETVGKTPSVTLLFRKKNPESQSTCDFMI